MPQHNPPWDVDPSLTQRGVGPFGHDTIGAPTPDDPARYRLGSRLGDTGQVYEAQTRRHAGRLVVKLFPFGAGLAPTAVAAFTREAERVAGLRHPHIAQVIHAGAFTDGTPFVAMERLFGQALDQRIAGRGALPISEALPLIRGIASALSAAHAAGVVHRDVRPDNVFVADIAGYEYGFAKLLDFGVGRLTAAARAAGRIVDPGTERALPPEQAPGAGVGDRTDERTDQFALSALAYRLLTGGEAFAAHDRGPAFERVVDDQQGVSPGFVRCAPAVQTVLDKAMSKRPENRYDSVALFFRAFEEAALGASPTPIRMPTQHDAPTVLLHPGVSASTIGDAIARVAPPTTVGAGGRGHGRSAVSVNVAATNIGAPVIPGVGHADPPSRTLRAAVAPPASLTQQFFVDGDQQEIRHREHAARLREEGFDEDGRSLDSYVRVPRRRAPLIVVALAIGFAIGAWATDLWSPFAWFAPSPVGTPSVVEATPPTAGSAPSLASPPAQRARETATATVSVPVAPPSVAPVSPPSDNVPGSVAQTPPVPPAPIAAPVPGLPLAAIPTPEQKTPLRGFAWSPDRRKLVRAQPAPFPSESPPPPAQSSPPPPASWTSPPPVDPVPPTLTNPTKPALAPGPVDQSAPAPMDPSTSAPVDPSTSAPAAMPSPSSLGETIPATESSPP